MDADLEHVRQLIFNEATESEKIELRKKWLPEPLIAGTTRLGVASIAKGANKVDTAASSFFIEMIDEEIEKNEEAAAKARRETEESRSRVIKADERELSKHFAKLIENKIARVSNGELAFELPNSKYLYSVRMDKGNLLLNVDSTPVERSQVNGDAIRTLAKLLAKNPQPKQTSVPAAEPTAEQRLRSAIKNFVVAFEELRKVS